METRVGSEGLGFYGMGAMDLRAAGKKSLAWDLNDWNWDGDLFLANRVNSIPSRQFIQIPAVVPVIGNSVDNSAVFSRNLENERGKRELEKRRREIMVNDEDQNIEEVGGLGLELGGNGYPISEREVGSCGKKTKLAGGRSSRAVCQVVDCGVDLSNAKDYHRRHKVCEKHSKATRALVGNLMQRFCQQCSRFHVLQEFDEGKRSCRRRLAGHNRRRRKANPDAAANGSTLNNDQSSSYLLMSLLKILSNMHSLRSEQTTDQDLLSRLLRSLAGYSGEHVGRNVPSSSHEPRNSLTDGVSPGNSEEVLACDPNGATIQASSILKSHAAKNYAAYSEIQEDAAGQVKMNNFDLNNIYIDSDEGSDEMDRSPIPMNTHTTSLDCPSWVQQHSHQSSPPQTSGNSDSASALSPSSSDGDAQSRTDRIVFKLFGKEPNDFPLVLREQVLDWLSHSPTDMESYIRPGCIVLTIYLRQPEAAWDELCYNLSSSLDRLLDVPAATFWKIGWLYIRVQHQIAFVYNGQVVVDRSLTPPIDNFSQILSVKPVAICASESAQFNVKGINLSRTSTRLLCAINGNYMVLEDTGELTDDADKGHNELQCVKFSCSIPTSTGRGFIEIEDQGLSSSFFPFIVAEEDVSLEIRMLEDVLELTENADSGKARSQAMDFIHEMGWLLHRSQLRSRLGRMYSTTQLFTLGRFKWLMEFSVDHEWCAVVKKLLNILLDGNVGIGDRSSMDLALSEMSLLHRAVRRNSRPLVEVLLRYVPNKLEAGLNDQVGGSDGGLLFRPDMTGPAGLTPLHIAAGKDGSEDVLDALTDDPRMMGVEAWKNAHDSTGSTPEDYARLRGHYSYIHLVQKKLKRRPVAGHVVVNIPAALSDTNVNQKQNEGTVSTFEIGQRSSGPIMSNCKHCYQTLPFGIGSRSQLFRPAMLSMVAIAAVCVCVALLFKSCPEVVYVFSPFRWELLDYGTK